MRVCKIDVNEPLPSYFSLGRQGENLATQVRFDITAWIGRYGGGTAYLIAKRAGDPAPYPVAVTRSGSEVLWDVSGSDTAVAGYGSAELQYYVGEQIAKSEIFSTFVEAVLEPAGTRPPAPYESWVSDVLEAARDAQAASEAVQSFDVSAESFAAGSSASAVKSVDPDTGAVTLTFGIPRGTDGVDGVDGVSPAVTVGEIEGGHRVTITDAAYPRGQSFDVMDGADGGTGSYNDLADRPQINGHTLSGNQTGAALGLVDAVTGKGLSANDYTDADKTKLAGLEAGAQANVIESVQVNGSALPVSGKAVNVSVPTNNSQLTNGAGYVTAAGAAAAAPVQSVNGATGAVTLGKSDVGLGNVDNTSDADKPISTAAQTALNGKQAALSGTAGQYVGYDANGTAAAQSPDTAPTQGSAALITSGAVYAVLGDVETLLAAI